MKIDKPPTAFISAHTAASSISHTTQQQQREQTQREQTQRENSSRSFL
jgi:hypothetical protein